MIIKIWKEKNCWI